MCRRLRHSLVIFSLVVLTALVPANLPQTDFAVIGAFNGLSEQQKPVLSDSLRAL